MASTVGSARRDLSTGKVERGAREASRRDRIIVSEFDIVIPRDVKTLKQTLLYVKQEIKAYKSRHVVRGPWDWKTFHVGVRKVDYRNRDYVNGRGTMIIFRYRLEKWKKEEE